MIDNGYAANETAPNRAVTEGCCGHQNTGVRCVWGGGWFKSGSKIGQGRAGQEGRGAA